MISFLSNFIALFLYKNNIIDKEKNEVCQYGFEINPKLKTTKSDAHIHGIGLRSVREIIDNLDRIFNITQNEKCGIVKKCAVREYPKSWIGDIRQRGEPAQLKSLVPQVGDRLH